MKFKLIILSFIFAQNTYAASNFAMAVTCRTVDGVPMTGAMVDACCNGADTADKPECKSGFHAVNLSALYNIQKAIEISNATLGVAAELTGIGFDPAASVAESTSDKLVTGGGKPAGFAMNSGGGPGADLSGYKPNASADLNDSSGSGSAGGAGGGSGLGFGLSGGSGSKAATAGVKGESLASKDGSGGYTSGGGGAGHGGGSSGSGGAGVTGEGADLSLGNGKDSADANALNDEDGIGSATDPSDYFKRIDPSANIFKIVSARYGRKKSLWSPQAIKGPQIVPVIKR